MNKKTKFAILGVIGLVLVTLSLTYAYWLITRTQTKENTITAGCLDILLSNEKNDISLTEQFPISDEEGLTLTPYTFTVTNNCNTSVDYYLNLEALGDSSTSLSTKSLKVMVNDYEPTILGNNFEEEPTIADAYASYRLDFGTLAKNGSTDYTLRLWIDEDAPISEMNKSFSSKVSVTVGQGINNPLKEGTLAYDLVSQYGGKDEVTKLSTDFKESEWIDTQVHHVFNYLETRHYEWGTDYEFDKSTGKFKVSGKVVTATIYECVNGIVECGIYSTGRSVESYGTELEDIDISMYEDFTYDSTGGNFIAFNAKKKITTTDFDNIPTDTTKEMHTVYDNYGTSYFLRGNIENNYVKFGKWSDTDTSDNAGKDMYWRIVRINGDGTIRLIYDGVEKVENGTPHITTISTTSYNSVADVDYTYLDAEGKRQDSIIKAVIDEWYEKNLKSKYSKYIADNIFCVDKEEELNIYVDEEGSMVDKTAASNIYNYYSVALRTMMDGDEGFLEMYNYQKPKLICSKDYSYNVSGTNGNGYLKNPVGLITADEVVMAGIYNDDQTSILNYLNSGESVWTMSPGISLMAISGEILGAGIAAIESSEVVILSMGETSNAENYGARPVINLKADVAFTGNGTIESPYVITTN